ncbi:MAG: DUF4145 domain-containing protein [Gammaproteobacteria bacterium]|nr:DUF4145 domain-containing protein [Gammaproteobacteria bacterium]
MSELVADCPRCGAQEMTFDLVSQLPIYKEHNWQMHLEVFCICRRCSRSTTFLVSQKEIDGEKYIKNGLPKLDFSANKIVRVERYIGLRDISSDKPPDHLPGEIEAPFNEGAACMAIGCYNAAGTMFRLCIDLATRAMLPDEEEGLNNTVRRNLGLRLPWLFDNNILPEALRELSTCIKDDGNDGAHQGTLSKEDAADILDFTYVLLERLYTEPVRIQKANERRAVRRNNQQ